MPDDVNFSAEVVKFIQETVHKDGRWMALMVKTVYEKYGREVIDAMCKAFYELGMEEGKQYKKEAGFEGREDEINVAVVMKSIYPHAFPHLRVAGFNKEIIKFSPTECDIKFSRCPVLDAWKTVWDKPWLMCEIAKAYDEGFMHGVNPKLAWSHYAEKDGQEGLARGKESERNRLIFDDEK